MPDEQVAAVATYLRNSWGNAAKPAKPVTSDEVEDKRALLRLPPQMAAH